MKTLLNNRYDIRGSEISRVTKTALFAKIIPIGNLRRGPGIRCLAVLAVLHYGGGVLYWFKMKYGHRLQPVRRKLSQLRKKS